MLDWKAGMEVGPAGTAGEAGTEPTGKELTLLLLLLEEGTE